MWLKRWNRVGVILLPVLKVPFYPLLWAYGFFKWWIGSWDKKDSDEFFVGCLGCCVFVVVTLVVACAGWQWHLSRHATHEEIQAARAADTCFDGTIVRRAAVWQRPITVADIVTTQHDCEEMWKQQRIMDAQKAALKP
jgi:hypothetical protein